MTLERDIETDFCDYARSQGCLCLKLRIDGQNGFPDRTIICPGGSVFWIEFKRPGGVVRPEQRVWRSRLQERNGKVFVCDCPELARRILDGFLERERR